MQNWEQMIPLFSQICLAVLVYFVSQELMLLSLAICLYRIAFNFFRLQLFLFFCILMNRFFFHFFYQVKMCTCFKGCSLFMHVLYSNGKYKKWDFRFLTHSPMLPNPPYQTCHKGVGSFFICNASTSFLQRFWSFST